MEHSGGIDASLELSSVCVVDATVRIIREGKVASEPEALVAWFCELGLALARMGLEAGPLSQWLYAAMRDAGFAVELLETRHVRDAAFKAMPVRRTGRMPAALPSCCGRAGSGKLLQAKYRDVEMCLRGVLRGFGLKVGPTAARGFAARVRPRTGGGALDPDRGGRRGAVGRPRGARGAAAGAGEAPARSGAG